VFCICLLTAGGCSHASQEPLPDGPAAAVSSSSAMTPAPSAWPTRGAPGSPIIWRLAPLDDAAKIEVRTVVQQYWSMLARLNAAPDPDDRQILALSVDPERAALVSAYAANRVAGMSQRGGVLGSIPTISIAGESARVTTCLDLSTARTYGRDGKQRPQARGAYRFNLVLQRIDNIWKVSNQDVPGDTCRVPH
jgi:hypothetical protein